MRISDWSSDVCSSDLRHRPKQLLHMPPGSPRECYRLLDRQPGSPDKVGRMIWVFISKGQSEEEPHVVRYVQFPLHNGRIVAQRTLRTRSQAVSGQCQHQRLSKHTDIGGFPYATPVRHGQECYMRRAKEPEVSKK